MIFKPETLILFVLERGICDCASHLMAVMSAADRSDGEKQDIREICMEKLDAYYARLSEGQADKV